MGFQLFTKQTYFNFITILIQKNTFLFNFSVFKSKYLVWWMWMSLLSIFYGILWKSLRKKRRRSRFSPTKLLFLSVGSWRRFVYPSAKLSWGDLNHNSIKTIMNVRFFRNARRVLFYQIYALAQDFGAVWSRRVSNRDWEDNGINIYYRIRAGIKFLRFSFLRMFNKMTSSIRQANTFLHPLRKFSSYQFLWFTEFNLASILIKLKFSTSLYCSRFILGKSLVSVSDHIIPHAYSIISPNTYIQFILHYRALMFLKVFFLKFFKLLKFFGRYLWAVNRLKRMNSFSNRRRNIFKRFLYLGVFDIKFTKLFEMDYMTLTFIFLPPINNIILINYIHFLWANHWNHKVVTWKYLT